MVTVRWFCLDNIDIAWGLEPTIPRTWGKHFNNVLPSHHNVFNDGKLLNLNQVELIVIWCCSPRLTPNTDVMYLDCLVPEVKTNVAPLTPAILTLEYLWKQCYLGSTVVKFSIHVCGVTGSKFYQILAGAKSILQLLQQEGSENSLQQA